MQIHERSCAILLVEKVDVEGKEEAKGESLWRRELESDGLAALPLVSWLRG